MSSSNRVALRTALENETTPKNNFKIKMFSSRLKFDTNLSGSPMNDFNNINNSSHYKSQNTILRDSNANTKKKKMQKSIIIAQNRVFISNFKREISSVKKKFLQDTQSFQIIMNKSRQIILKELLNLFSKNHFPLSRFNPISNEIPAEKSFEIKQKNEKKIYQLNQTIKILQEQNKQLQLEKDNANLYRKEIDEKDEYNEKLNQMKKTIKEQKSKIKQIQDQNFIIVQLQTQIDDKNREIKYLKMENADANQKLEHQIKQNSIAADDIEFTFNQIEKFKKEIADYNISNSELQLQINNLSHEVAILKESNMKISEENSKLKNEIAQKDDQINHSINAKNSLINQIKEKEEIIDKANNEISILTAEKSLNQSSTPMIPKSNNDENYSNFFQIDSKQYRKMKKEIISLSSQVESQKNQISEQCNLIQALRANLQQNENELNLINQNSRKDKSAMIRKEGQTLSLQNEILRLEGVIHQKDEFISKILENDQKRSSELDRLQESLEEARNKLSQNEIQNDDHLSTEFKKISEQLKNSHIKINKLNLISEQQKFKIDELQQENDDLKTKLNRLSREISTFSDENLKLKEKLKNISKTYTLNASKMQKVIEFVKNQNSEISVENSNLMKRNQELQNLFNSSKEINEKLNYQVSQLQTEKDLLSQKVNFELEPLKNENFQIKSSLDHIKNHDIVMTEENQRLYTEIESLKKEKEAQKKIDDQKIIEINDELKKNEFENNEMKLELEKYKEIIHFIMNFYKVSSSSNIPDVLQKNQNELTKTKNELAKTLTEKIKIQSENKLLKLRIKSQENIIEKNESKIEELLKELQVLKDQNKELINNKLLISKYEKFCDDTIFNFLEEKENQFERLKNNRSFILATYEEIQRKIEDLFNVNSKYDELGDLKIIINEKYLPGSIKSNLSSFSNILQKQVAVIDSENVDKYINAKPDFVMKIIETFKTFLNSNKTVKIVEHLLSQRPVSNHYPIEMTKVQPEYWNSPTKFINPLYSDEHAPIICNNENELHNVLDCIYYVKPDLDKTLGGGRFIEKYSKLYTQLRNEPFISIRSPNALGIQRNQDPDSLYVLVSREKLSIEEMYININFDPHQLKISNIKSLAKGRNKNDCDNYRLPFFFIKINNITNEPVSFNLQKGTVIDVPMNQQPLFISETCSGTIKPNDSSCLSLKWCSMDKHAKSPYEDYRLTPFIFIVPEEYDFSDWPYSNLWWEKIQPDISKKISKTNELWDINIVRPNINRISTSDFSSEKYLPTKAGGVISDKLFEILNKFRDYDVDKIDSVVRSLHMADKKDAQNVMICTNQYGIVINFKENYLVIEKTESGVWDGGYVKKIADSNIYDNLYYIDYKIIPHEKTKISQIINGMKSDPKCYDSATYNSQDSRQFLLGTLGISIPTFHSGQILIPSLHDLIDF